MASDTEKAFAHLELANAFSVSEALPMRFVEIFYKIFL